MLDQYFTTELHPQPEELSFKSGKETKFAEESGGEAGAKGLYRSFVHTFYIQNFFLDCDFMHCGKLKEQNSEKACPSLRTFGSTNI